MAYSIESYEIPWWDWGGGLSLVRERGKRLGSIEERGEGMRGKKIRNLRILGFFFFNLYLKKIRDLNDTVYKNNRSKRN